MSAANDPDPLAPPGTHLASELVLSGGQRRTALVAALLIALAAGWVLHPFLPALGWATIVAVSLWPVHEAARARWPGLPRDALPAVMTALVALAFVGPAVLIGIQAAADWDAVREWVAQANAQGVPAPDILASLPFGDRMVAWWQEHMNHPHAISELTGSGGVLNAGLAEGRLLLASVTRRVVTVLFMLLILYFMLRNGEWTGAALHEGARRAFGPPGEVVSEQVVRAIRGTVNGLVIVGLSLGVLMGLSYAALGVPHAALLGLMTGLLSAIPFAVILPVAIAALLLAALGKVAAAVAIAVVGAVVIFVSDHFIRPILIGGSTRLPFVLVLLGILGGLETLGLIGVVAGPALMAAVLLLWREWTGQIAGPLNPPADAAKIYPAFTGTKPVANQELG